MSILQEDSNECVCALLNPFSPSALPSAIGVKPSVRLGLASWGTFRFLLFP